MDIVSDLRTHRQGRAHIQIEINASYLIAAEDEIVLLREKVRSREAEIERLKRWAALDAPASV